MAVANMIYYIVEVAVIVMIYQKFSGWGAEIEEVEITLY